MVLLPSIIMTSSQESIELQRSAATVTNNENGKMTSKDLSVVDGSNFVQFSSELQRIYHLEKSLHFLQSQHKELVSSLHSEIDQLKRKNRELQFCIVMMQQNVKTDSNQKQLNTSSTWEDSAPAATAAASVNIMTQQSIAPSFLSQSDTDNNVSKVKSKPPSPKFDQTHHQLEAGKKLSDLKIQFMEEEIKHLKKYLDESRMQYSNLLERLKVAEHQLAVKRTTSMRSPSSLNDKVDSRVSQTATGLPYNATVDPLLVHFPPHQPRAPTLHECQSIVKYLYTMYNQQAHELKQLKLDLRDVLYSHKWTPDAYLLARAYVVNDDVTDANVVSLPRVPLRHATKKLPDAAYQVNETTAFPPMRPTVGNQAVERQKRTQILHKIKTLYADNRDEVQMYLTSDVLNYGRPAGGILETIKRTAGLAFNDIHADLARCSPSGRQYLYTQLNVVLNAGTA